MGEISKNIGERGEEIVKYLFEELLGYKHYQTGISISCVNESNHHPKENKKKTTHGIDGLVFHKSTLVDNCLEIGVISSKYTSNPYPNSSLRSTFRNYLKDLAWTIECFHYSDNKSTIESNVVGVEKTHVIGVLFWLSNHDDSYNQDTMPEIAKAEFGGDGLDFGKIIYVDNARVEFIVNILEPLKRQFGRDNYHFVYPDTGFNLLMEQHKSFGTQFPMIYFAYDIIPIRILNDKNVYLYLACRKNIDIVDLSKIIGLAKTFNHLQATTKTLIGFPNYNKINHEQMVSQVLASFLDDTFTNQIEVINHNPDFRNLNV